MLQYLQSFIEIRAFGYNIATFGFLGTVVFTVVQIGGLVDQVKVMRAKRSAQAVPLTLIAFFAGEQAAFLLYGLETHRLAAVINGLLAPFLLVVFLVAARFPDAKRYWWHTLLIVAPLPLLWYLSREFSPAASNVVRESCMLVLIVTATLTLADAPISILRARSAGAIDRAWLFTMFASCSFWSAYTFATSFWTLFACNILALGILSGGLLAWTRYRKIPSI